MTKIESVDTYSSWADWCNWMFVRARTDDGLEAWGEGSLHGSVESVRTAINELKPVLVGERFEGPADLGLLPGPPQGEGEELQARTAAGRNSAFTMSVRPSISSLKISAPSPRSNDAAQWRSTSDASETASPKSWLE